MLDKLVGDELTHYGVLGMKWGVRKNRGQINPSTKRYEKKLASDKLSDEKRQKYTERLKLSKEHDKRMQNYVKSLSKGKTIVRALLLTPYGSTRYAQLRADNVSKGRAIVSTVFETSAHFYTAGIYGTVQKRFYGSSKYEKR